MRPHPRRLSLLAALLPALLLVPLPQAEAGPKGPPYYDPARGIKRQQEAADAARQEVAGGSVEKAFEHLASVSAYVRDAVFAEITGDWNDEQLARLAPGLLSPDPFVAGQVAEILGTRACAPARAALEKALGRQRNEEVLGEICWALGRIGDRASVSALERALRRHGRKSHVVGADATLALARCDAEHAVERLRKGLAHKLTGVRMVALDALVRRDPAAGLEAALGQLGAKQQKGWEKRMLLQVCASVREPEQRAPHAAIYRRIVDVLIDRLARETARPRHEIGRTLRSLTGEWDMGDDAASWRDWWKVHRESFVPIARDRKKEEASESGDSGATVTRYFGIPIHSDRLVFMLDLSGGMDRPLGGRGAKGPSRLSIAKKELIETLGNLDPATRLNVVFFATKYRWAAPVPQLLPAGRALRRLAAFIEQQQIPDKPHMNRGNIYDPLVEAMQLPEVDTIYLLSEGNPTEGRFVDRERFVRHMLRVQRFTRTEVHALFIGSARSAIRYMKAIAEPTGGRFHDVGHRDGR